MADPAASCTTHQTPTTVRTAVDISFLLTVIAAPTGWDLVVATLALRVGGLGRQLELVAGLVEQLLRLLGMAPEVELVGVLGGGHLLIGLGHELLGGGEIRVFCRAD